MAKKENYDNFIPEEQFPIQVPNQIPLRNIPGFFIPITFTLKNTEPQTAANGSIIFTALFPCEVIVAIEIHDVAAATSTTYNLTITKDTGTGAIGSGNNVLTSTFDLMAVARTKQVLQATLTIPDRILDKGDRLTAKLASTGSAPTAIKDMNVTIYIKPITNTLNASTT